MPELPEYPYILVGTTTSVLDPPSATLEGKLEPSVYFPDGYCVAHDTELIPYDDDILNPFSMKDATGKYVIDVCNTCWTGPIPGADSSGDEGNKTDRPLTAAQLFKQRHGDDT